ncbi:hypothetical protein [Halosimplex halophilum]|uniref:hypothetical protein n=1 Tax=Halosimplex halophilum TaxID=2559572 RepID=UPI00107FAA23|nr:hypothetical protein [Halosimplex halophilum]
MTDLGARSFADRDTEFYIDESKTPVTVDGYAKGEPMILGCRYCSAQVLLTRDPTDPGVDDFSHDTDCPQRFVRSRWFRRQLTE